MTLTSRNWLACENWFTLTSFKPLFHFYTPLKTSGNPRFSNVFRRHRNGTLCQNWLSIGPIFFNCCHYSGRSLIVFWNCFLKKYHWHSELYPDSHNSFHYHSRSNKYQHWCFDRNIFGSVFTFKRNDFIVQLQDSNQIIWSCVVILTQYYLFI